MKPKEFDSVKRLVREAQQELFGWTPYEEYALMHPTETRWKIRERTRTGVWQMGVHVARPSRKEMWVHLRNIKAWVEGQPPAFDPVHFLDESLAAAKAAERGG